MAIACENDLRFAVLIDADNVSDKYIKIILDEVANVGVATYKRIYGDWTSTRLSSWKNCLLDHSITPMQQYSYTVGKNATDSAMIIDAMDILYSGTVDGFAIVSSDSDFTRLASRLRESGMQVIGMGEQKTPKPFISACNQFKYLDLLFAQQQKDEIEATGDADDAAPVPAQQERSRRSRRKPGESGTMKMLSTAPVLSAIDAILDIHGDDDGWIDLAWLGNLLVKRLPDFDVRNYGFNRLLPFLKSLDAYEFNEPVGQSGARPIRMRMK